MGPKFHDRVHHSPAFVPVLTYMNPDHACSSILILYPHARPSFPSFGKPQGKRFPWSFPKLFRSLLPCTLSNTCLGFILKLCFRVRLPFASDLLHGGFGCQIFFTVSTYTWTHILVFRVLISVTFSSSSSSSSSSSTTTWTSELTHCGRVTQICVFNTVKLGTSASSP